MERLKGEFDVLEKEWNSLSQNEVFQVFLLEIILQSPLATIQREKSILEGDKDKFIKYIALVQGKKQKVIETCASLSQEFDASGICHSEMLMDRKYCKKAYKGQRSVATNC